MQIQRYVNSNTSDFARRIALFSFYGGGIYTDSDLLRKNKLSFCICDKRKFPSQFETSANVLGKCSFGASIAF